MLIDWRTEIIGIETSIVYVIDYLCSKLFHRFIFMRTMVKNFYAFLI